MKTRLLTPGPVAVPERVRRAMSQALIHHRGADFGVPVKRGEGTWKATQLVREFASE